MTKPSDFLLGILDFFAVLMPGAVATWLASHYLSELRAHLNVTQADDGAKALAWVALLFTAYVLGHFVFMLASALDGFYDRWRRWRHPKNRDDTYQTAKTLYKRLHPDLERGRFTTLKWARAYVQIHSAGARLEIDRFDANSKFFRSFVVVSALLVLHYAFAAEWALAAAAVALGILSFSRYCDQRWKAAELSYATAVMLHAAKAAARARNGNEEAESAE